MNSMCGCHEPVHVLCLTITMFMFLTITMAIGAAAPPVTGLAGRPRRRNSRS